MHRIRIWCIVSRRRRRDSRSSVFIARVFVQHGGLVRPESDFGHPVIGAADFR